jgi:hypothetical protein
VGLARVLALLALASSGCFVDLDFAGTRFRCAESGECPDGYQCVQDECLAASLPSDAGATADAANLDPPGDAGGTTSDATIAATCGAIDLQLGTSHLGNTIDSPAVDAGLCTDTSGPEVFHRLVLGEGDVPATVRVTTALGGTNYDAVLYARSDCEQAETELACNDDGDGDTITFTAETAGSYYLIVDSHTGGAGNYEILATLE